MALTNDEMTKRYFVRRLLTEPELPDSLPRYVTFLESLSPSGSDKDKVEWQRQYFCQGLSSVLESTEWRTRTIPATIAEKYQQRCFKSHPSESSPAPTSTESATSPASPLARILTSPRRPRVFIPSRKTEAAQQEEDTLQAKREEKMPPVLPSLYLVEVGSERKSALKSSEKEGHWELNFPHGLHHRFYTNGNQ